MKNHQKRRVWSLITVLLFTFHISLFTISCTTETYDSGDGEYSYLRADFVEAHTVAAKQVDYAVNDDGERITLSRHLAVNWATTPDSLYRGLLYYKRKPTENEPVSLQRVYVLTPKAAEDIKSPKFDPVTLESAWLSRCQLPTPNTQHQSPNTQQGAFYLNLSFLIKTGLADDPEAVQSIGMQGETQADGTVVLTLLHDQANVPQYYSTRIYASIPLAEEQLKKGVALAVNTYDKGNTTLYFNLDP